MPLAKFAVSLSIFAVLVAAIPTHGGSTTSQCNTGDAQCCNHLEDSSHPSASTAAILGLLGIALNSLTGKIGVGCTPISVIGAGQGANCAQTPVCCQGNNFNGLVNLGCSPLSL